jgi:hypothetical protein
MPLRTPDPPAEVVSVIERELPEYLAASEILAARGVEAVQPALPHRIYSATLEEAARGLAADDLETVGWRFLLLAGEEAVAAVEVGDAGAITQLEEGHFVGLTSRAVEAGERLGETRSGDFEVRLVRIPALFFLAVWLHGDDRDLLLPLDPEGGDGVSAAPTQFDDLTATLRDKAERKLRAYGEVGPDEILAG